MLPWDREHCRALGNHRCSGDLGCRVDPEAAKAWNETAPTRWSDLHRRAYQQVQRELGRAPWMLARVFEMQHRGVLHVHPVLAYGSFVERRAADRYLDLVNELAPHYGFGFTERKRRVMPARAAAAYLSSYFVTGKKEKITLQKSVLSEGMPRSIIHISVKLTQQTGCTMRELRFRRFVWRVAGSWVVTGQYAIARGLALCWQQNGGQPKLEQIKTVIRANDPPGPVSARVVPDAPIRERSERGSPHDGRRYGPELPPPTPPSLLAVQTRSATPAVSACSNPPGASRKAAPDGRTATESTAGRSRT